MSVSSQTLVSKLYQFLKEMKFAPVEQLLRYCAPRTKRAEWIRQYHHLICSIQPHWQQQLRSVLARHPKARAVIVFTPSLDWERQLFQRPQQLALALSKQGALVFYVQTTRPGVNKQFLPIHERLFVTNISLAHFSILEHFFAYTLTWNRKYLLKLPQAFIHYDYLDDLAAFEGDSAQLLADHHMLVQSADLVTTTAHLLSEQIQATRPDALLIPNGVVYEHFAESRPVAIPEEMKSLHNEGKPIIGFYGAFAGWLDYPLLYDLVLKRPDLNFVLIGPRHSNDLAASGLETLPNVHYLGAKPYAALPAYLACFDVALLPFLVNQITQSTSPIKLFEYFAGGKPVVSTPLREVVQYPETLIGENSQEFSQRIDEALSKSNSIAYQKRLQQIARENTWENHAERILQVMEQRLSKDTPKQQLS